jgi:hypothetical protein
MGQGGCDENYAQVNAKSQSPELIGYKAQIFYLPKTIIKR